MIMLYRIAQLARNPLQAFELKTSTDDPEVLSDSGENIVVGGANR